MERTAVDWNRPYPLLPLRDIVVLPGSSASLFVGRPRSIAALETAFAGDRLMMLATQKQAAVNDPAPSDIHLVGCVARIVQIMRLPDGAVKALVEGDERAHIERYIDREGDDYYEVDIAPLAADETPKAVLTVLRQSAYRLVEQLARVNENVPADLVATLGDTDDPALFCDRAAANLVGRVEQKQALLATGSLKERLELLADALQGEIEVAQIDRRVRSRVKKQMEKSQRDYYLNEQIKAIQKELGRAGEDGKSEFDELKEKIAEAKMPPDVEKKALKELKKLEQMPPLSAEGTVSRNYIDWLTDVPWAKRSRDKLDLSVASAILDEDHYGLDKIKERIVEYLAVRKLVKKSKGPVLCFVGPPGVGKTSLGRSIARSMGRQFVRFSLGGIRDEAEIRGHRRTYIGALPGRIVQAMKKAGTKNPVIMLDEIDKIGLDFRGDPSSALLEALDPEQNFAFNDHYLEVDYDLSEVMFVTTANTLHTIPGPLRDRMEIIELSGYTDDEKVNIARRFLIPKQVKEHGLKEGNLSIPDESLSRIVRNYTRESGVRELERRLGALCRKVARAVASDKEKKSAKKKTKKVVIDAEAMVKYLGQIRYRDDALEKKHEVGLATGLAWTEVGGALLKIEVSVLEGKGKFILTGKLGEVMKESANAALSYLRARRVELGLPKGFHEKNDIHIHLPEGAIPKEGPSAGLALATAMVSALTGRPVRRDVAMTGEITLRGRALPIGGLKEKLLAAVRAGVKTVLIPEENQRSLAEIPAAVKEGVTIVTVKDMDEVLRHALAPLPPKRKGKGTTPRGRGSHDQATSAPLN